MGLAGSTNTPQSSEGFCCIRRSSNVESSGTFRVVLVPCTHPKCAIEIDPLALEVKTLLDKVRRTLISAYALSESQVQLLEEPSPEDVLQSLVQCGNVFVFACGHGGCKKLDEYEARTVRGCSVFSPKRDPTDPDAAWLELPKGRLHWQAIRDVSLHRKGQTAFFIGACYSGSLFQSWLPAEGSSSSGSAASVVAITSADPHCQAGSWSWHELVRHLQSVRGANLSFAELVRCLRALDPTVTWVNEEACGEPSDAALVSLWGRDEYASQICFRALLGQDPILTKEEREQSVTKPQLISGLASDQRVISWPMPEIDEQSAFVGSIVKHGFALLDIGNDMYNANVAPIVRDARTLLASSDEEAKFGIFDRTLDRSDENTNCGWAIAPDTWEMYKFVYSGACMEKDEYPWPASPNSFRQSIVQYYEFMEGLTRQLCLILAHGIGPDHGGKPEEWSKLMDPCPMPEDYYSNGDCRLFRYYGSSEMSTELFQGEVHADLGMLAVGPLSDVDGIHWFDRRDMVWRAPELDASLKGRPIIAVWPGDVLRCLTGGWIAGGVHRVKLSPGSRDRYSLPFFIRARRNVPIRCLASQCEDEHYDD